MKFDLNRIEQLLHVEGLVRLHPHLKPIHAAIMTELAGHAKYVGQQTMEEAREAQQEKEAQQALEAKEAGQKAQQEQPPQQPPQQPLSLLNPLSRRQLDEPPKEKENE